MGFLCFSAHNGIDTRIFTSPGMILHSLAYQI